METYLNWKFNSKKEKSQLWYIVAFSIVIWLAIWGFTTKQYAMSFVVILIAGMYIYTENNTEDEIEIWVTDLGIKVWDSFYDYSKIESYNMIYDGDLAKTLRLKLKTKGLGFLELEINNELASSLNDILPNYIEEDENSELTFVEKLIKILNL